jgi:hypothetical protein
MYRYHQTSRTFLLGLDNKDYSQYALEWGMQELFEDNDEIVILRVIDSSISPKLSRKYIDFKRKKRNLKRKVKRERKHIKLWQNSC